MIATFGIHPLICYKEPGNAEDPSSRFVFVEPSTDFVQEFETIALAVIWGLGVSGFSGLGFRGSGFRNMR